LAPPSLPPSVAGFVRNEIHSVSQLEVLLLLRERGEQWSSTAVAEELRITAQSAELRLRDLHLRGLLHYDPDTEVFAYRPKTARLRSIIDELAANYSEKRYTVIALIFPVAGPETFRFRTKGREPP
jgi:hypothetical protein